MSDLDKYKEKINQVEDSGLESTSRTLAILKEVGDVDSMRCNVKTRYNTYIRPKLWPEVLWGSWTIRASS